LLAVLALAPRISAQQAGETPSIPSFRVDVSVVRVAASVTQHGVPVKGLSQQDFRIREDSVPQEIRYFWQEHDLPLTVGLVVDVSGSQASLVHKHRDTLKRFLRLVLRPEDRAMIVTVGPQARLLTDFTSSQDELADGIEHIRVGGRQGPLVGEACKGKQAEQGADEPAQRPRGRRGRLQQRRMRAPCGGTALWNAIYWTARTKMKDVVGRKALIVLSDGWDTGSEHNLDDAIEASQAAETPVYTIKFVDALFGVIVPLPALKHPMQRLSDETGGLAYGMWHGDLGKVFDEIETDLRNLYVLGYTSTKRERDGKFRRLEVTASKPGLKVRTRTGYWAKGEAP